MQRAGSGVHEMTGLDKLSVRAAVDQCLLLQGLEIQHGHLRIIDPSRSGNGEQHRAAARKNRRKHMIGLVLRGIRFRQHPRRATSGCDAHQSGGSIPGRKHDRVVRTPTGTPRRSCDLAQRDRRAAAHRHLPELAPGEKARPTTVIRDEWPAGFRIPRSGSASRRSSAWTISCVVSGWPSLCSAPDAT